MASIIRKTPVWLRQIAVSLKSSWISLLIILIILLLTSLEQSDTIVIDLLDQNWGNLLLFTVLLVFLTQILSHYPIYLEIKQTQSRRKGIIWHLRPVLWGFGFITFTGGVPLKSKIIRHLRNMWGLLLLGAVFYLLVVVHSRNIELLLTQEKAVLYWRWIQVGLYALFCGLTYFLMGFYFTHRYAAYRKVLINATLLLFLLVFAVAFACSAVQGWSRTTYWWVYAMLYTAAPCYSSMRLFRGSTLLKEDLNFLIFIALGGLFSIVVLVLAHIYVFAFNPLVILLAQFIVIYGMVVIPIKHFFYYRQREVHRGLRPWPRFSSYGCGRPTCRCCLSGAM